MNSERDSTAVLWAVVGVMTVAGFVGIVQGISYGYRGACRDAGFSSGGWDAGFSSGWQWVGRGYCIDSREDGVVRNVPFPVALKEYKEQP